MHKPFTVEFRGNKPKGEWTKFSSHETFDEAVEVMMEERQLDAENFDESWLYRVVYMNSATTAALNRLIK